MGKGQKLHSTWSEWPNMVLQRPGSKAGALAWASWFWNESSSFPVGRADGTPSQYVVVGSAVDRTTITQAMSVAVAGDIVVLPAGTYTEDFTMTAGVTLRAAACAHVIVNGNIDLMLGGCTFRGIEFHQDAHFYNPGSVAADFWWEACTFYQSNQFDEGYSGNVTFNRCLFTSAGVSAPSAFFGDGTSAMIDLNITSCVFLTHDLSSTGFGVRVYDLNGSLNINNTTVVNTDSGSPNTGFFRFPGSGPGKASHINRVMFASSRSDAALVNFDDGDRCTASYNIGCGPDIIDTMFVGSVHPDTTNVIYTSAARCNLVSAVGAPRTDTPGVTTIADPVNYPAPLVDFNGFAFASSPSVGAFQAAGDSSALYRPWFDMDLLTTFTFSTSLALSPPTPDSTMLGEHTFLSPLEVACWINAYVQDVVHPSRGSFFVSYGGYYRLVVTEGDFSLNLSGDPATLLGAFNQAHITDTGT